MRRKLGDRSCPSWCALVAAFFLWRTYSRPLLISSITSADSILVSAVSSVTFPLVPVVICWDQHSFARHKNCEL
jgi:hypothetical protein